MCMDFCCFLGVVVGCLFGDLGFKVLILILFWVGYLWFIVFGAFEYGLGGLGWVVVNGLLV